MYEQDVHFKMFKHKVVETFHVVSECKTVIYFSWCWIQALAQPVQLFWPLVTFGVTSCDSLTIDRLRLTTINRDRKRPNETFILTLVWPKIRWEYLKIMSSFESQFKYEKPDQIHAATSLTIFPCFLLFLKKTKETFSLCLSISNVSFPMISQVNNSSYP